LLNENSTTGNGGLGLSLLKELISISGGSMEIKVLIMLKIV
jgi:hypothetical protein